MANNPYNNKVELSDGTVLMDLTGDTVTPGDLLVGVTAHDRSGAAITGTQKGVIFYGTCSTTASTQAKTVTINGITEYYTGLNLRILFTKAQDYNGVPTLNVNSIGAVNIGRVSGTNAARYEWGANEVLDLVYDGTRFVIVASGITDHGTVTISSTDQIKSLTPGAYRIYQGDTDIFPYAYGILVITKASAYSTALFYPVNVSNAAAVYRKTWNNVDDTWYENTWKNDINASDLPLTVANGGTGASTAANARTNLGLGTVAVEDTVPVSKGGTGATSAAKALANLGLGTEAQGLTFNDSISQNQIASFRFIDKNDLSDYTNHQIRFVIADGGLVLWDGTSSAKIWGLSFPIPIADGGTGLTASPSVLTNLASTTEANILASSPRPGVTGTLPIANGGTGLTSSPSMLTNLESTSAANVMASSPRPGVTGTLPAANGGTGETSLAKFAMNRGTTISSISSDTALLDYDTGFYKISLSAASSYIPTRYGVLELIKADNYGVAKYTAINSSAGHYWIRAFHATNKTWYDTSWLQIL